MGSGGGGGARTSGGGAARQWRAEGGRSLRRRAKATVALVVSSCVPSLPPPLAVSDGFSAVPASLSQSSGSPAVSVTPVVFRRLVAERRCGGRRCGAGGRRCVGGLEGPSSDAVDGRRLRGSSAAAAVVLLRPPPPSSSPAPLLLPLLVLLRLCGAASPTVGGRVDGAASKGAEGCGRLAAAPAAEEGRLHPLDAAPRQPQRGERQREGEGEGVGGGEEGGGGRSAVAVLRLGLLRPIVPSSDLPLPLLLRPPVGSVSGRRVGFGPRSPSTAAILRGRSAVGRVGRGLHQGRLQALRAALPPGHADGRCARFPARGSRLRPPHAQQRGVEGAQQALNTPALSPHSSPTSTPPPRLCPYSPSGLPPRLVSVLARGG